MKGLDLLWELQQKQLEMEEYERVLKDTPTRKKLLKLQKFLQAGQARLIEMENAAKVKEHKVFDLEEKNKAFMADIEDLEKDFSYFSECDVEELDSKDIQESVKSAEKLYENIVNTKKHLTQIKQELEQGDAQIKDILRKVRAAKTEYDELYAVYHKETAAGAGELKTFKEAVDKAAEAVPKELLDEYNRIKGFRQNPVAIVKDSRCQGCNMSLPSGMITRVKASEKPVECENCGRILFIRED